LTEHTPLADADYDAIWATSGDNMKRYGPTSRHTRRLIFKLIEGRPIDSVLDAGCGPGMFLEEIAAQRPGIKLAGSDISEVGLGLARHKLPQAEFYVLDLRTDVVDRQFDLVVCSEVLEHIDDDRAAIANLHRMTGKYLVVTTVQGAYWEYESKVTGHVRSYTRADLETKLREAGFDILQTYEWGWPFYSPLYRNYLSLTKAAGTRGEYTFMHRLVASLLYALFSLNARQRGDKLIILAAANS
jgi:SAM-dependent methyltransferase